MKKCKVAILFRASQKFGYGHLYRALRLGCLLNENYDVKLICNKNNDVSSVVEKSGLSLTMCDENEEFKVIRLMNIQILIIDRLEDDVEIVRTFKNVVDKLVILEASGEAAAYADAIINMTLELPQKRPERSYQGIEYMVFSDEIEFVARKEPKAVSEIKKVLISFGGSDPNNISELMIPVVKSNREVNFQLILGPGYENRKDFIGKYRDIKNLVILKSVDNMPELMYESDLCIVSGGLTLFECVYLQKRIVVACQVQHQIWNAENLANMGSILNLGIITEKNREKLFCISDVLRGTAKMPERKKYKQIRNGKYKIEKVVHELVKEIEKS